MPTPFLLQELCRRGQELLAATQYCQAERVVADAEQLAWENEDWDTLSRLYLPLQEARRQKRQLALEGKTVLDAEPGMSAKELIKVYNQGEFILCGEGNIGPGLELRRLAREQELYIEAFLAAIYSIGSGRAVLLVGLSNAWVPPASEIFSIDQLIHRAPPHSLVLAESEFAGGGARLAMNLWQRLHLPYLAAAGAERDPVRQMQAYRTAIAVDHSCEVAHQKLSYVAGQMGRKIRYNMDLREPD